MNDATTISPYLMNPIRTLDEALAAIASHPVSAADRRKLALLALSTASKAVAEGDVASARMFIADAQLHLKEMGAVVAGTRIVEAV